MKTRSFLVALLASGAIVGCGGDDNEALSYDGFVSAANEVCAAAEDNIDQASQGLTGNPKEDVDIYDELIPALGGRDEQDRRHRSARGTAGRLRRLRRGHRCAAPGCARRADRCRGRRRG